MAKKPASSPADLRQEALATALTTIERKFGKGSIMRMDDGAALTAIPVIPTGLLSIDAALVRVERDLGVVTDWQREWVRDELVRLWKVRGPFPGLAAVLTAFGLSRGPFVAHALQEAARTVAERG